MLPELAVGLALFIPDRSALGFRRVKVHLQLRSVIQKVDLPDRDPLDRQARALAQIFQQRAVLLRLDQIDALTAYQLRAGKMKAPSCSKTKSAAITVALTTSQTHHLLASSTTDRVGAPGVAS